MIYMIVQYNMHALVVNFTYGSDVKTPYIQKKNIMTTIEDCTYKL